jgi:hypothetical protein
MFLISKRISFLLLAFLLAGCANSAAVPSQSFTWQVQVVKAEIKSTLKTTETVTLYNGDMDKVLHENNPTSGNQYLLLSLKISKNGAASGSFDWKDVKVQTTSGESYPRLANDSFIAQHNYNPRLTGLTIRFGENEGWVCFEIPAEAANGRLFLVHTTGEGQQKIEIKK